MKCGACGFDNPAGMQFCGACGNRLVKRCPKCGFDNPAAFKFCGGCGSSLAVPAEAAAPPAPEPPPPPPPPPAAPTPPPAPARPAAALEGDRRNVTILFADVKGSTAMAEKLDPEQFTSIMNECFRRLTARITKYDGTIDKYIGDAIMALFGAPVAHENDPERCIRAALEMQETLRRFSTTLEKRYGLPLSMRIGVNTGEVVAGGVGSEAKFDYTVMGDTVNTASRLEHAAEVGKILVSHSTYVMARNIFDFKALDPIRVKGKSEPLAVYEVVGLLKHRGRARGIEGLESKLIGRAAELEKLKVAYQAAQKGNSQVVAIVGEAGLGKTRLLDEFQLLLREEDELEKLAYLKGRSLPYSVANTYGAIISLLRDYFGIEEEDRWEEVERKMLARLEAPKDIGPLRRLLAGDARKDEPSLLSPEQWKRETFAVLRELIASEASRHPVVLVLEDLHWVDPSSLEALDFLIQHVARLPVLFCLLYRPDFTEPASWRSRRTFQKLELRPLTAEQGNQLIESLLVVTDMPLAIKELIMQRSGGNPFYVEEILKSFMETQVLVKEGDIWRATKEIANVAVPDTVQSVVMARVDRLEEDTRRVLQQAAVIGRHFSYRLLAEVSDVEPLDPCLDRLEETEFIFRAAGGTREPEYTFKHVLSQEVAYNSLLLRRRKAIHRQVGEVIEKLYADQLEQQWDALAQHYYQGEAWLKALEYCTNAAERAKGLYANREALQYYDQVLTVIDHLEKSLEAEWTVEDEWAEEVEERVKPQASQVALLTRRGESLSSRGDIYALIGQYDDAVQSYEAALSATHDKLKRADILWRLGDRVYEKRSQYDRALQCFDHATAEVGDGAQASTEMAKIHTSVAKVYTRQGKYEQAKEMGLESVRLLEGTKHHRELARALRDLGTIHYSMGQWDEAIACWESSLEEAQLSKDPREMSPVYNNLGVIYHRRSDYDRAIQSFEECLRVMEKIGDTSAIAGTYTNLGICYRTRGDYARAIDYYQRSLTMKDRIGDARGVQRNHLNLGELLRETGNCPKAIQHLEKALQIAEAIGAREVLAEIHRQLAECYMDLGDLVRAVTYSQQGLDYARSTGNKLEEGIGNRVLGRAFRRRDDLYAAEDCLMLSVALLRDLKSGHEMALSLAELGTILAEQDRDEEAGAAAEEAAAILQKLGATRDLKPLDALRQRLKKEQRVS